LRCSVVEEWLGRLLVVVQFALLAWLAWRGVQAPSIPIGAAMAGVVSVLLGLWALASNPPGNFNIRPTPHPDGQMISAGPYRWVRHPMYAAVLLFGVACAWADASWDGWLATAPLAVVLTCKALMEERWMLSLHPGYAAYRAGTARIFPGIF